MTDDTPSMLDRALRLALLGYFVFPIVANGRVPAIAHWPQLATRDPQIIRNWWIEIDPVFETERVRDYNIGVFSGKFGDDGKALLIIDVDQKKGKNGRAELATLDMMHGVPETRTAETPTTGLHMVYEVDEPLKTAANVLAKGLDTRSGGGYIVGAGSIINGKEYKWIDERAPVAAPQWMIDKVGKTALRKNTDTAEFVDSETSVSRAIDYLTRLAPPAIEGSGGDEQTYKVAAATKDLGVSELTALELMAEHYNPRCAPGWTYEELAQKINNAFHYGTKSAGASSVNPSDFDPVPGSDKPAEPFPDPEQPKPKTIDELAISRFQDSEDHESSLEPDQYIIGDIACRGYVTAIVAAPAIGKSLFTLTVAVAAASGRADVLGMPVHEPCAALILNNEDNDSILNKRLYALKRLAKIKLTHELFIKGGSLNPIKIAKGAGERRVVVTEDVGLLVKFIRENHIGVVVLDPTVEIHEAEENDNVQMAAVMSIVRRIAAATECAVLLVHHTRKPPAAESEAHRGDLMTARGAGSFGGNVRRAFTIFGMDKDEAKNLGVEERKRHRYMVLDDAKGNYVEKTPDARWFFRESVRIGNGEDIVALRPVTDGEFKDRRANMGTVLAEEIVAISDEQHADSFTLNEVARLLVARPMFSDMAGKTGEPKTQFRETIRLTLESGARSGDFEVWCVNKSGDDEKPKWGVDIHRNAAAGDDPCS